MDFVKGHSHGLEVASSQITGVMQTQPPEQRPEQQKSGDNCWLGILLGWGWSNQTTTEKAKIPTIL